MGNQQGDIGTCGTANSLYLVVGKLTKFHRGMQACECLYPMVENPHGSIEICKYLFHLFLLSVCF